MPSPSSRPHASTSAAAHHPRRHSSLRRRRTSSPPSCTLSALFAIVVATLPAGAVPVTTTSSPPDFLCPSIALASNATSCSPKNVTDAAVSLPTASPSNATSSSPVSKSTSIADRYVSGTDGRWRKTNLVSLYGSTVCLDPPCDTIATPSSTISIEDYPSLAVDPSSSLVPPTTTANSSSESPSNLPSGWPDPTNDADEALTPVIIVLAIVLAFGILLFITMLVHLRKKRRLRLRDAEKKGDDGAGRVVQEDEDGKRARTQQKLWAKASARWKANARQAARRRRKRPSVASKESEIRPLTETFSTHNSQVALRTVTDDRSSGYGATDDASSLAESSSAAPAEPSTSNPPSPTHPPAYLPDAALSPTLPPQSSIPTSPILHPRQPNKRALASVSEGQVIDDDVPSLGMPTSAHVATDDKAVLARMAGFASAPPVSDSHPGMSGPSYASVPPLEDDDGFEPIPFQLQVFDSEPTRSRCSLSSAYAPSYSRDTSPNPSILPPPPPKNSMAAPTFYDYPASFEEDVIGLEPDAGPSAPPFELDNAPAPSAPPLDIDYIPPVFDAPSSAPFDVIDREPMLSESLDDGTREMLTQRTSITPPASPQALVPTAWFRSPPGYLP